MLSFRPNEIFFGGTVPHKENFQNQLETQITCKTVAQILAFISPWKYCIPTQRIQSHDGVIWQTMTHYPYSIFEINFMFKASGRRKVLFNGEHKLTPQTCPFAFLLNTQVHI